MTTMTRNDALKLAAQCKGTQHGYLAGAYTKLTIGKLVAATTRGVVATAGYTGSFAATVNPLVGLDTIKRLGGTYVKILFMGLALILAWTVVGLILGAIFSVFDLPGLGNLPAKFIGALFSFYLSVVFSCVLGYALFKKSDTLAIHS